MNGPEHDPENEADGPEEFRPVPHPDDRLWRHPSEMAAMRAAQANAETVQLPVVQIIEEQSRSKLQVGLMVTAGVVLVGAAALTLGLMSGAGVPTNTQVASEVAGIVPAPDSPSGSRPGTSGIASTEIAVESTTGGEDLLAARVHREVASSLPRIQAATADGMREGSGLFVTDDGHIATSAGLIDNAEYILAWTEDDQRWKAHVVASDPVSDIAIIQIESEDWPAAAFGTGTDLWAGQYALALDHDDDEISLGKVTTVAGPVVTVDQPSAVPGSAIVDDTGAVIAMITADGTNEHATPAWILEQVTVDLITTGATVHVWLGVIVESDIVDDGMVAVSQIIDGSPADDAGLRAGDLIDSMNGLPIADSATLHRHVRAAVPGEDAVLTVTRNGSRRIIIATLAELPD